MLWVEAAGLDRDGQDLMETHHEVFKLEISECRGEHVKNHILIYTKRHVLLISFLVWTVHLIH